MTDKQIQAKLNQLTKIANELVTEAKSRYGDNAQLFYESEGTFYLMDGDGDSPGARQKHIRFTSAGYCLMGGGAW